MSKNATTGRTKGEETDDHAVFADTDTDADHEAKEPVNEVYLSSIRQFHVPECVICGEEHWHGSKDAAVARGERSHRTAHCHGVEHSGGYFLQLAEDADPPERWYNYVDLATGEEVDR